VGKKVFISLGVDQAMQAARSLEFIRRNLERISVHLPKDRHAKDIYRQIVYDSSIIYANLHDELEMAAYNNSSAGVV